MFKWALKPQLIALYFWDPLEKAYKNHEHLHMNFPPNLIENH